MDSNLLINGVYWVRTHLITNHLLTSWDIQVLLEGCLNMASEKHELFKDQGCNEIVKKRKTLASVTQILQV